MKYLLFCCLFFVGCHSEQYQEPEIVLKNGYLNVLKTVHDSMTYYIYMPSNGKSGIFGINITKDSLQVEVLKLQIEKLKRDTL